MKNLIISTYYNNPHFVAPQIYLLNKFITDDDGFDLVVINDAGDAKSILSGVPAAKEIEDECKIWGVKHLHTPQQIHKNICDGGLVPEGLPASHPTERHRANLNWLFKNFNSLGFYQYGRFLLIESDMFLKKEINLNEYIEDYDIMGTFGNAILKKKQGQYWHPRCGELDEIDAKWLSLQLLAINLNTVKNIENLDAGGFAGTDSGGATHFFLKDNPQYKLKYMLKWNDIDAQVDFISKEQTDCQGAEFLHYRGGTNWDHNTTEYYYEKMYRAFEKFIPSYGFENSNIKTKLYSSDREHCFAPR